MSLKRWSGEVVHCVVYCEVRGSYKCVMWLQGWVLDVESFPHLSLLGTDKLSDVMSGDTTALMSDILVRRMNPAL